MIGTDDDNTFNGQPIIEVETDGTASAGETIREYRDEYSMEFTGDYAFEYQTLTENGETQSIQPQTSIVIGGYATAADSSTTLDLAFATITMDHQTYTNVPF